MIGMILREFMNFRSANRPLTQLYSQSQTPCDTTSDIREKEKCYSRGYAIARCQAKTTLKSYWHELRDHQEYCKKIAMKTGTHTQVPQDCLNPPPQARDFLNLVTKEALRRLTFVVCRFCLLLWDKITIFATQLTNHSFNQRDL